MFADYATFNEKRLASKRGRFDGKPLLSQPISHVRRTGQTFEELATCNRICNRSGDPKLQYDSDSESLVSLHTYVGHALSATRSMSLFDMVL